MEDKLVWVGGRGYVWKESKDTFYFRYVAFEVVWHIQERYIKQLARNTGWNSARKYQAHLSRGVCFPTLGSPRLGDVSSMFKKEGVKEAESPLQWVVGSVVYEKNMSRVTVLSLAVWPWINLWISTFPITKNGKNPNLLIFF